MNQLYRTFLSNGSLSASNAGLSPEQNFGQEITVNWRADENVDVQATFFHNQVSNYLASTTICSSTVGTYAGNCTAQAAALGYNGLTNVSQVSQNINVGNATMYGWEGSINYAPVESLKLNFGITMLNTYLNGLSPQANSLNNQSLASSSHSAIIAMNKQLPYVMPWTITQAGDWNLSDLLLDGLTFNYVIKAWPAYYSSTIQQQYGSTANYNSNNSSTQATGAVTGDIAFNYKAFKQVDFNLSVQNIGDRYYVQGPGSSSSTVPTLAMPFNVMGGVRVNW